MKNEPIPRLDQKLELRNALLRHCRLQPGQLWADPLGRHRVGCLDAADAGDVEKLVGTDRATVAIHDPPYNLVACEERSVADFIVWCRQWITTTDNFLAPDASLYVWMGADQNDGFQPLPDFMLMMRKMPFRSRSFLTMRNQRGYGTQKNWMAVRQELLYFTKGSPTFNVDAEYTDIPKTLRGYYKDVGGVRTENLQRSKSENIRAGNVWVDVQQVFYRMEENVNGCYAQKPLKSCDRILRASTNEGELVIDFFSHSGSTLLSAEMLDRRCFTMDVDPVFCEITIRRLEQFWANGRTGWQNENPFSREIAKDTSLRKLLRTSNFVRAPSADSRASNSKIPLRRASPVL